MQVDCISEYVPASRQTFVLNRLSYIGCLGTKVLPLTIKQALQLLTKLEINHLERSLGTTKE